MDNDEETIEFRLEGFRIISKIKINYEKTPLLRTQDYCAINKSLIESYQINQSVVSSYHHTGWVFVIKRLSKYKYQHLTIKFPDINYLFKLKTINKLINFSRLNNFIMNVDDYTVFPE